MQHEPGHRETVMQRGGELLESIERRLLGFAAASDVAPSALSMLEETRLLKAACQVVRDYEALEAPLSAFEAILARLGEGELACDDKLGGVLLQAISTFRHALSNLGTGTRAADILPKVLQDLSRVMNTLGKKTELPSQVDEFREAFLRDDVGIFQTLAEICDQLTTDPMRLAGDKQLSTELFRLMHTVKGNSAALGFEGLAIYTHDVEDLLQKLQTESDGYDVHAAKLLAACCEAVCSAREAYQREGANPDVIRKNLADKGREISAFLASDQPESASTVEAPPAEAILEPVAASVRKNPEPRFGKFFLSVRIGQKNWMIPHASVAEVLRNPQIMALPGSGGGVIRFGGALVPVVAPDTLFASGALSGDREESYLVVLRMPSLVSSEEHSELAISVDDVGEVVELPFEPVDVMPQMTPKP